VGDWIKSLVVGLATKGCSYGITYFLKENRSILEKASMAVGDILLYQARGDKIRESVRKTIQSTQSPVILLAHSLGGVICADILIKEHLPQVKLLVTVGSQSPYFYEIDALQSLPFENIDKNQRLSPDFPRWLNIYDRRDFLSHVGATIFGEKITDFEVDNRQAFPFSHLSYWSNSATWDKILQEIQQL
jgi:hypothetical protein